MGLTNRVGSKPNMGGEEEEFRLKGRTTRLAKMEVRKEKGSGQ